MSLCNTCGWCIIRKFYSPHKEDYIVLVDGDDDDPMIIQHCIILDMPVAGEHTKDCNHYKLDMRGDDIAIQLSMWERDLYHVHQWPR